MSGRLAWKNAVEFLMLPGVHKFGGYMTICRWIQPAAISVSILLSSCATSHQQPERYLSLYAAVPESYSQFVICNQVSCDETTSVHLTGNDWQSVQRIFQPPATGSESERTQIAQAIARLEQLVGDQAGTFDDQPRNQGSFRGTRQLDCVAEATNTTIYLMLMKERGLLHWHGVGYPKHRGLVSLQFPHNTAVLIEKDSNRLFAVDSYFHANGEPPEIVPLASWVDGYDPGT